MPMAETSRTRCILPEGTRPPRALRPRERSEYRGDCPVRGKGGGYAPQTKTGGGRSPTPGAVTLRHLKTISYVVGLCRCISAERNDHSLPPRFWPASLHMQKDPSSLLDQWFVTNGVVALGPVEFDRLASGVAHGRIPATSFVRHQSWKVWRELSEIE